LAFIESPVATRTDLHLPVVGANVLERSRLVRHFLFP
jgi:hypothetical protein